MSDVNIQWFTTGVFLIGFIAAMVVETLWLVRKGWATPQKAVTYVMITDSMALCLGFLIPFLIIGTILALAWSGDISNVPGGDATVWAALAVAIVFPIVFLLLVKRVLLALFRIRTGGQAWKYAAAVSLFIVVTSFVPPVIVYNILQAIW